MVQKEKVESELEDKLQIAQESNERLSEQLSTSEAKLISLRNEV